VISLNGNGPEALLCAFMLCALGLYILYWVIRLAVRHAFTDVGVRRPDRGHDDDAPTDPHLPQDRQSTREVPPAQPNVDLGVKRVS
jgi:cell division septation protein DedD